MKALITGGAGFIGSHLHNIIPDAEVLDHVDGGPDIKFNLWDESYTHIFHLAALKSVPLGERLPREFIDTNCWGTLNLMRSFPKARIINISSSAANDVKSVYGATKAFSEHMGHMHPNWLNVRLYNVFGPGQPLVSGAVVPALLEAKKAKKRPIIYGDGEQCRDFTYVLDVVEELKWLMFETDLTGLRHAGYGTSMSVNELANIIFEHKVKPVYKKKRSYEITNSRAPYPMTNMKYGRRNGLQRTMEEHKNGTYKTRIPA